MSKKHNEREETISLFQLDQFIRGELDEGSRNALMKRLEHDAAAQDYIREAKQEQCPFSFTTLENRIGKKRKRNFVQWWIDFYNSFKVHPVLAGAAVCVLLIVSGYQFLLPRDSSAVYSTKGKSFDVTLVLGDKRYNPGDMIKIAGEATLSFDYRASEDHFVWFILKEDDKEVELLNDKPKVWNASGEFIFSSQQLVLEGDWKKQEIWIVASVEKYRAKRVKAVITKEQHDSAITVFPFYFINMQ